MKIEIVWNIWHPLSCCNKFTGQTCRVYLLFSLQTYHRNADMLRSTTERSFPSWINHRARHCLRDHSMLHKACHRPTERKATMRKCIVEENALIYPEPVDQAVASRRTRPCSINKRARTGRGMSQSIMSPTCDKAPSSYANDHALYVADAN